MTLLKEVHDAPTRRPETTPRLRVEAVAVLKVWGVVGRRLTAGKLAEALAVDFQHHRRAVVNIWRL